MPGAHGGDVLSLSRALFATIGDRPLIVNDRIDVAMIVGASGVHLGERSVPIADARSVLEEGCLIGRSVHSVDGAIEAARAGADYLLAGHVYETASKAGQPGRGVEWLADVCRTVDVPVVAIGGISVERVSEVMHAGAWGIAVGREILEADDPGLTVSQLTVAISENEAD